MTVIPSLLSAQRTASPDWNAFDKYVAKAAADWRVPALAIAVVKDDSLVFAKGYGVLEMGKAQRADAHTRFAIGSTTKAMTAASLAMLIDEGKLQWDDRVSKFVPELELADAYASRELTIRDLLTHRTGLGGTDMFWVRWRMPMKEIIPRLRYVKPETSFRSNWEYQNVMFAIGGLIVERASGIPWDAFVRTRIFAPLGMTESEPLVSSIAGKSNVAVPHALSRDTVRVVPVRSTDDIAPAGSVWSSVTDMSKWMRFMLDSGRVGTKRLIQPATFRELVAPQIRAPIEEYPALRLAKPDFFSYGLGWFLQDYRERMVWMHTGSIDGMCAIIGLMPNERVGVYVLENLDHAELRHGLMYSVFDLYTGGPSRDWSADLRTLFAEAARGGQGRATARNAEAHPSLSLERYAGTYVDSAYGTVTVTFSNGALHAQVVNEPERDLDPWEYEVFRTRSTDPQFSSIPLTFQPNGAGGISSVQLFGIEFKRVRTPARTR